MDLGVRISLTLELGIGVHMWQLAFSPSGHNFSHTTCSFLLKCDFDTCLHRGQRSVSHLSNLDRLEHK